MSWLEKTRRDDFGNSTATITARAMISDLSNRLASIRFVCHSIIDCLYQRPSLKSLKVQAMNFSTESSIGLEEKVSSLSWTCMGRPADRQETISTTVGATHFYFRVRRVRI